jgi:hypothetical protein
LEEGSSEGEQAKHGSSLALFALSGKPRQQQSAANFANAGVSSLDKRSSLCHVVRCVNRPVVRSRSAMYAPCMQPCFGAASMQCLQLSPPQYCSVAECHVGAYVMQLASSHAVCRSRLVEMPLQCCPIIMQPGMLPCMRPVCRPVRLQCNSALSLLRRDAACSLCNGMLPDRLQRDAA